MVFSLAFRGHQGHGGLGGEQAKGERLLQVEFDGGCRMAEIADGEVLADVEFKVAAARGEHKAAFDGGCPDDVAINKAMDVLQDRIAFFAAAADSRVRLRTQNERVWAVDPRQA